MIREDLVFVKQPLQSRKAVIEFIAAAAIKAGGGWPASAGGQGAAAGAAAMAAGSGSAGCEIDTSL